MRTSGSGAGDGFISAKWQFNANGVYMLPYNIELGANVFTRQGYPLALYRNASLGVDGNRRVLITPKIDSIRYDNLWDTDIRVARTFKAARASIEAIADLFNIFNSNTELVRVRNAGASNFRDLAQNLSPRIVRFGLRVGF